MTTIVVGWHRKSLRVMNSYYIYKYINDRNGKKNIIFTKLLVMNIYIFARKKIFAQSKLLFNKCFFFNFKNLI
jgi:hypothetical protein